MTIKIDSCHKERDFTINMYTTTSKILVNGKNQQLFFQRDLRKIHSIINSATSNRSDTYIETLNTKLAEQLEKLVSTKSTKNEKENTELAITSNINEQTEAKCTKCKKKCKTRGTYCTHGKHWIHYNCEKLSSSEIENLQKSNDCEEYTCNICKKQSKPVKLMLCHSVDNYAQPKMILSEGNATRSEEVGEIQETNYIDSCYV